MEKNKLSRFMIIALVLLNLGMMIFVIVRPGGRGPHGPHGQHGPHGGPGGPGGPKQIIIDRLQLDDGQQKKFDLMVEKHHTEMDRLHEESRKMHDDLYIYLKSDTIDKVHADSIMKQIADNQYRMENLNFSHFEEIRSLCRPEQLDDYYKLVDELGMLFSPKGPPPPPPGHGPGPR